MKKVFLGVMLLGIQQTSARSYTEYSYFSGTYFGTGVSGTFSESKAEKKKDGGVEEISRDRNQLFLSLLLGGSKESNGSPLCFGGEIGADFSTSKKAEVTFENEKAKLTYGAINASVGFFVGYVSFCHRTLLFLKGGVIHGKTSLKNSLENLTVSQLAPFVGVGIQKAVCPTWHVRFSVDLKMKTSKSNDHYHLESGKSLTVRFMLIRNIKY
ncbi:MAG: hypothetical protein LBJ96_02520 [Holosporaceae bacterium]|jgi:hypothetical protein|nr:hypothetical protein [Holosporaceae bacterium]